MKALLVAVVKFYQAVAPKWLRERCIFRDSCSHYVARIASEDGFWCGLRALFKRYRNCRGGYHSVFDTEKKRWMLHLTGGMIVDADDLAPAVRARLGI